MEFRDSRKDVKVARLVPAGIAKPHLAVGQPLNRWLLSGPRIPPATIRRLDGTPRDQPLPLLATSPPAVASAYARIAFKCTTLANSG